MWGGTENDDEIDGTENSSNDDNDDHPTFTTTKEYVTTQIGNLCQLYIPPCANTTPASASNVPSVQIVTR